MTTKNEIREWLRDGIKKKATHMIVVCDSFSHEDYPKYIKENENINNILHSYPKNMQRIMEVYSYRLSLDEQLEQRCSWNL